MTSRDFCYWLQGYLEIDSADDALKPPGTYRSFAPAQMQMIKNHLRMVFVHEIDPSMGPKPHQDKLSETHLGSYNPLKDPDVLVRC